MNNKRIDKKYKICVIGCGNMGASIVRGMAETTVYPQNIIVTDPDAKKMSAIKKVTHCRTMRANRQVASIADVLFLAVKPDMLSCVMEEIESCLTPNTIIVSIAAGIKIARIQKSLKQRFPIFRVMPNMPAVIGEGISAFAVNSQVTEPQKKLVALLLTSLGKVTEIKENAMDVVTAVSGSGPAYFFLMVEKMIEAAYELGLKSDVAKQLVYQTAYGSIKLLIESGEDPDVLISRVASKGGTTEAALKVFERKGFGKIIQDAVDAAKKRSETLSEVN